MDFIIEKLYNRTTTAPILSDLEIEIFKIENEIKNKEIQLNEIKKDNIKKNKENDDLMKEYNELIEIEKNYLLLMNDLDKETEIFNFFS
jgi:septal ring factor EnvC (AmiA/AmiB activator)